MLRKFFISVVTIFGLSTAFVVVPSVIPSHNSQAFAISKCNWTNSYGAPSIKNGGPRRNNHKVGWFGRKYEVAAGSSVRACITHTYIHAGYDIRVECSNGVWFWMTKYGWNNVVKKSQGSCARFGGSNSVKFFEYKQ